MAEEKTREFEEAKEAILVWLDFAEEEDRRRSPVEASVEKTMRILRLEAAWALFRVGATADGLRLSQPSLHELEMTEGRVETGVAGCYSMRLTEAKAGELPAVWPNERYTRLMAEQDSFSRLSAVSVFDAFVFAMAQAVNPVPLDPA